MADPQSPYSVIESLTNEKNNAKKAIANIEVETNHREAALAKLKRDQSRALETAEDEHKLFLQQANVSKRYNLEKVADLEKAIEKIQSVHDGEKTKTA